MHSTKARVYQCLPGVILWLVSAFTFFTIGGSSLLEARLAWASVWGLAVGMLGLIPVVAIQLLVSRFLTRHSQLWQQVIVNGPLVIGAVCVLGWQWKVTRPQSRFVQMLAQPVPSSVRVIHQGGLHTLDSEFWVLRFHIPKEDFLNLVAKGSFEPRDSQGVTDQERLKWILRLKESANMRVDLDARWMLFTQRSDHCERHLFFDADENECVFVFDAH